MILCYFLVDELFSGTFLHACCCTSFFFLTHSLVFSESLSFLLSLFTYTDISGQGYFRTDSTPGAMMLSHTIGTINIRTR